MYDPDEPDPRRRGMFSNEPPTWDIDEQQPIWKGMETPEYATSTTTTEATHAAPISQPCPSIDPQKAYDPDYMQAYQKALRKFQKAERRRIYDNTYRRAGMLSPEALMRHVNTLHHMLNTFKKTTNPDKHLIASLNLLALVGAPAMVGQPPMEIERKAREVYKMYSGKHKKDSVKEKILHH